MKPTKPAKRRRLRAPLEPGIATAIDDDPRSALHGERRHQATNPANCFDVRAFDAGIAPGCAGRIEPHPYPTHPSKGRAEAASDTFARYAELHCLSNFSFQRGASSARELFERARKLGYAALAITDECSLAGIVRALEASDATGV
ncbi:MAG: PHP domain-containing protein, partial [Lysobacterales bacterium]